MSIAVELFSAVEAALNDREIAAYEDFTEAVRLILAEARKAEALQQEVAELRDVMKDCHAALKMMVTPGDISGSTVASAFAAATSAECRARTLLGGENAE